MRANGNRGLREEQKQQTRARLMAAARSLFGAHGYAAVRVDDIAASVGCSRATFYLHFGGKTEILRAVSEQGDALGALRSYEALDRVLDSGSRAEFVGWVTRTMEWFAERKDLLQAWDEATVLEPEFREVAREGIRAVPDAMPAYLAGWPADRRDEARLRVELFVAQLERFFTRWAMQGTIDVPVERAAEVLADIWHPALRPPGGAGDAPEPTARRRTSCDN